MNQQHEREADDTPRDVYVSVPRPAPFTTSAPYAATLVFQANPAPSLWTVSPWRSRFWDHRRFYELREAVAYALSLKGASGMVVMSDGSSWS